MRRLGYMNLFFIFRSFLAQHPVNSANFQQCLELKLPTDTGKTAELDSVESIRIWEQQASDTITNFSDTNGVEYVDSHNKLAIKLIP